MVVVKLLVELSWKTIDGLLISAIFKVAFPEDSTQFKMPSLSISISKLSIIKSLSKSSGQILTGISVDLKVAFVQSIKHILNSPLI